MSDASNAPITDAPMHPEEIKATYSVRIGNHISIQATARITPAGIIAVGVTTLAVALAFAYLVPSRRRGW